MRDLSSTFDNSRSKKALPLRLLLWGGGLLGVAISARYFMLASAKAGSIRTELGFALSCWGRILGAVFFVMIAHMLRALAWRESVCLLGRMTFRQLLRALAIGFLGSAILPFRLGEFIRCWVLGTDAHISKTAIFLSIVLERGFDCLFLGMTTLLLILWSGNALCPNGKWVLGWFAVVLLILGMGILVGLACLALEFSSLRRLVGSLSSIFNEGLKNRLRFMSWCGIYASRLFFESLRWFRFLGLILGYWFFYLVGLAFLASGFLGRTDFWRSLLISVSCYLSLSVPSGPGFLGTVNFYIAQFIALIEPSAAIGVFGFSLVVWMVWMIPISLVGVVYWARGPMPEEAVVADDQNGRAGLENKFLRIQDISGNFGQFLEGYFYNRELEKIISDFETSAGMKFIKSFSGGSNAATLLMADGQGRLFVRKVTLPQNASKLKSQWEWLQKYQHLKRFPRLLRENIASDHYAIDLAYAEGFRSFVDFIHTSSEEKSWQVLQAVLAFLRAEVYRPMGTSSVDQVEQYFQEKLVGKVRNASLVSRAIGELLAFDRLIINGKEMLNFPALAEWIMGEPRLLSCLANQSATDIHGDLTIENILVDSNGEFLLLDPNDENAISNLLLDFGKLYQSLHSGYEFLCQLNHVEVKGPCVTYEDRISGKYHALFHRLEAELRTTMSPFVLSLILLHEGIHYCRMLPYKIAAKPEMAVVFFCTAVKVLNEFRENFLTNVSPSERPSFTLP